MKKCFELLQHKANVDGIVEITQKTIIQIFAVYVPLLLT